MDTSEWTRCSGEFQVDDQLRIAAPDPSEIAFCSQAAASVAHDTDK